MVADYENVCTKLPVDFSILFGSGMKIVRGMIRVGRKRSDYSNNTNGPFSASASAGTLTACYGSQLYSAT
jgi:hypothetical protein